MRLLQKVLNKLNGLHYKQEYLCFAKEAFIQPPHLYISNDHRAVQDVTAAHVFAGYCPLVFAFYQNGLPDQLQLTLTQEPLSLNEKFAEKDALATLNFKKIRAAAGIVYYEGTTGKHRFLPAFNQLAGNLYNRLYNKKPGNVFLHDNLYRQVQAAYAVPRSIALITVGEDDLFNLFPTDLHGQVNETQYIISLRTGGRALEQVQKAGRLLLTAVSSSAYQTAYALGKNHMQPLRPKNELSFSASVSENFKWPLPENAIGYKELQLQDAFVHGIHSIMLFSINFQQQLQPGEGSLAHIHNSYATWRYKNKLPGNYLLR
ncbi:hypothetical protein [Ferruginibacter sp.]